MPFKMILCIRNKGGHFEIRLKSTPVFLPFFDKGVPNRLVAFQSAVLPFYTIVFTIRPASFFVARNAKRCYVNRQTHFKMSPVGAVGV